MYSLATKTFFPCAFRQLEAVFAEAFSGLQLFSRRAFPARSTLPPHPGITPAPVHFNSALRAVITACTSRRETGHSLSVAW